MENKRKNWKTNVVFLVALWLILLVASLTILSSVVSPFLRTLQTQSLVSLDWAGYGVYESPIFQQPVVTGVYGSWVVPYVAASAADSFSAAWIGIGGQSEPTLIQVGSEHDFISGQAAYSLWYEMLPADSISISEITISPGDQISASITLSDSSSNTWLIKIDDITTGQGFDQTFTYNSSRLTAEWIVERPTVNNQLSVLADFGSVTFSDIKAQIGDTSSSPNAFSNFEVLMEDRQNNDLVAVSSLSKNGSSFTINYR